MNLGELFPQELKKRFAERNIDVGKAILLKIEDLRVTYPKYIIIVSGNEEENP